MLSAVYNEDCSKNSVEIAAAPRILMSLVETWQGTRQLRDVALPPVVRSGVLSMTDIQYRQLELYETTAAECEMLARLTTDRSKQARYDQLALHYHDLATGFRQALELRGVAYLSMAHSPR